MAEFPALPFFTDAYLADTRHLTTEEHGAYLLLLMCAWRTRGCALADDNKALARIAGLSPTRWRRMRAHLEPFFVIEDGMWRQKKLSEVYKGVAARVARNRANGARGGRAQAAHRKAVSPHSEKGAEPAQKRQQEAGAKAAPSGAETPLGEGQNAPVSQAAKTKAKTKINKAGLERTPENGAEQPENDEALSCAQEMSHGYAPSSPLHTAAQAREEAASLQNDTVIEANSTIEGWRQAADKVFRESGISIIPDETVLYHWQIAGVDPAADMVPTLRALIRREQVRGQAMPKSLGYFREAVLEAAARRHFAAKNGVLAESRKSGQSANTVPKRAFDGASSEDWRMLLGDPTSRFRGDYMARHWLIPSDHPVFKMADLGPNPRLTKTAHLPADIIGTYGPAWGWL